MDPERGSPTAGDTAPAADVTARRDARRLVAGIRATARSTLHVGGIGLASALEQALFYALRDGTFAEPRFPWVPQAARYPVRIARTAAAWLTRSNVADAPARPIAILVLAPVHELLVEPVIAELERRAAPPVVVLRAGISADAGYAGDRHASLSDFLSAAWVAELARHQVALAARLRLPEDWPHSTRIDAERLRAFIIFQLSVMALNAAQLDSAIARLRPRLFVALEEFGRWSRLVPAVARRHATPSLDLPHAEAADPVAMDRLEYDTIAVYGPRAEEVMIAGGNDPRRLVQIGPLRFDPLIGMMRDRPAASSSVRQRVVVFAGQPTSGRVTRELNVVAVRGALAAAAAVAPCELLVKPHPLERPTDRLLFEEVLAGYRLPADVTVRVVDDDLHTVLPDSWLLVTGFSQSVFEAAISGVPAITVDASRGQVPVTFARDGLAIGATDPASAGEAARRLLANDERRAAVAQARRELERRIGPLDGRASQRAAELILARMAPEGGG